MNNYSLFVLLMAATIFCDIAHASEADIEQIPPSAQWTNAYTLSKADLHKLTSISTRIHQCWLLTSNAYPDSDSFHSSDIMQDLRDRLRGATRYNVDPPKKSILTLTAIMDHNGNLKSIIPNTDNTKNFENYINFRPAMRHAIATIEKCNPYPEFAISDQKKLVKHVFTLDPETMLPNEY